jgi:hypothetical protein
MEIFVAGAVNLASLTYIGVNIRRYVNFMKFRENKYLDKFHLLEGSISSSKHHSSFTHSYTNTPLTNLVISRLEVEIGKDKIGTRMVPIQVGKHTAFVPQQYHYVDWKMTHQNTQMSDDIKLSNNSINILISGAKCLYNYNHSVKESKTHLLGDLFKMFDAHRITYHYGNQVKMKEEYILQGDSVAVVGEYQNNNKEMLVKYIGNIDQVLEGVKSDICNFNDLGIGAACCLVIITLIYIIMEIPEVSKNFDSYKSDTERT